MHKALKIWKLICACLTRENKPYRLLNAKKDQRKSEMSLKNFGLKWWVKDDILKV